VIIPRNSRAGAGALHSIAGSLITGAAGAVTSITPKPVLALQVRLFLRYCAWRGERRLARSIAIKRAIASAASPLTTLSLQVNGKRVAVRMVPLAIWFRASIFSKVLSREQLTDISGRFTEKADVRVCLPLGLSLPVGFTTGTFVDATGSVLELLLERFVSD
jgi:hypothetical protein